MSKAKTSAPRRDERNNKAAEALAQSNQAVRETIESIALAVVLAFLFAHSSPKRLSFRPVRWHRR